jgi:hypothetical protein
MLELRDVIDTIATDLHAAAISEGKPYNLKRYPAE